MAWFRDTMSWINTIAFCSPRPIFQTLPEISGISRPSPSSNVRKGAGDGSAIVCALHYPFRGAGYDLLVTPWHSVSNAADGYRRRLLLHDLVKRKIAKTYSSIHDEITALRVWPVAIRGAYPETAAKGVKYYG